MAKSFFNAAGLTGIVSMLVCGCSAPSFLSTADVKKQSSNNQTVDSQNPPASQGNQPADEKELPPVDVAGVHLVTDCHLLAAVGVKPESVSVECRVTSPNETVEVILKEAVLITQDGLNKIAENGVSAKPANSGNDAFVLGPKNPISFHFDLPAPLAQTISGTQVSLQFSQFEISGRNASAQLALPAVIKKSVPPASCQTFKTSKGTWFEFVPEQIANAIIPGMGNVPVITGEPLPTPFGEVNAVHIFLKPRNPLPATVKQICGVQIMKPLVVSWTNVNPDLLSQQSILVMLGSRILFNSFNPMQTHTFTHPNSRTAELLDLSGIARFWSPFPPAFSNTTKWCPFGLTTCLFAPTSSTQTISLQSLPSDVLTPVAMNFFKSVNDGAKIMPGMDVSGPTQPDVADTSSLPLAVYFAWPDGLTSASSSPPKISGAEIELKYTYSE